MIYLMRHGQDDETYVGGWSDVSLILEGEKEVFSSALWMKENLQIKKIICSDIKRALESAIIVSNVLDVPYEMDARLREQNKGKLNGILKSIAYCDYPSFSDKEVNIDTVFPEGESLRDLYNRMKEYIGILMELEDDTLIITHRGVINMIYFILNKKELDMDKKQFGVVTASIHEVSKEIKKIKKVR